MTDILERVWTSHWHLKLEVAAEIERLQTELRCTVAERQRAQEACAQMGVEIDRLRSTLKLLQADYAALWEAYNAKAGH